MKKSAELENDKDCFLWICVSQLIDFISKNVHVEGLSQVPFSCSLPQNLQCSERSESQHIVFPSLGTLSSMQLYSYEMCRNRVLFCQIWTKCREPSLYCPLLTSSPPEQCSPGDSRTPLHSSLYSTKNSNKPERVHHSQPGWHPLSITCCMAWDTTLLLESQPAAIYQITDVLSFARWALRVSLQVFEVGFAFPCFSVSLHVTVVLSQQSPQNLCQLVNSLNAGLFFPIHAMKEAKPRVLPTCSIKPQNHTELWRCWWVHSALLPFLLPGLQNRAAHGGRARYVASKGVSKKTKAKMAKMLKQNSQQILASPNSHGCETLFHDTA